MKQKSIHLRVVSKFLQNLVLSLISTSNCEQEAHMPLTNVSVDLSARLVFVADTNSIACLLCPELLFTSVYRALLHSLKHRARCANGYPTKDNDNMVGCCPIIVTHETCLDLAVYGGVIVMTMEIVDNAIQLRVICNFKKENPNNLRNPLNQPCGEEFDNVNSYRHHVRSKHCQYLPKKQNGCNASKYFTIETIINKLEDGDDFGENVIYNFASTAWIKQPDLLCSKARAKELRWQLKLLNLLSDKTWANKIFISDVLGFDLELLRREASEWQRDHSGCNKKISSTTMRNWIRDFLPRVETVECDTSIIRAIIQSLTTWVIFD